MDPTQVAAHWEANAKSWTELARSGYDVFRDGLNSPAFFRMLPPVEGKLGLDIGCGEGANTRQLARSGACMQAIDLAPTFVRCAQEEDSRHPLGICYRVADAMDLPFAADTFDFATAFMSLMDMADAGLAVREVARVLRPNGFLQFSILHPCFVTPHRRVIRDPNGKARAIEVGDYFASTDGRVDQWWFTTLSDEQRARIKPFRTPIFHRPLSEWLAIVFDAGLTIEALEEPTIGARPAGDATVLDDTRVAPISLQVRARKVAQGPLD